MLTLCSLMFRLQKYGQQTARKRSNDIKEMKKIVVKPAKIKIKAKQSQVGCPPTHSKLFKQFTRTRGVDAKIPNKSVIERAPTRRQKFFHLCLFDVLTNTKMANKLPKTPHTNIEITVALDGADKNIFVVFEIFKPKLLLIFASGFSMPKEIAQRSSTIQSKFKHQSFDPYMTQAYNIRYCYYRCHFYYFHGRNYRVKLEELCTADSKGEYLCD